MPPSRIRSVLLVALATGLALTGCSKAPNPNSSPTASAVSSSNPQTTSASAPATTDATPTVGASTASASKSASGGASSTSKAPSTAPATSTATGPRRPACATAALTVTVQRGSGAAGHQFANIVFTNSSTATCSLTGYPGAVLRRGTTALGPPATRSGKSYAEVDLAPRGVGSALLTNVSTCNAANSDSVQVIVPNQTQAIVLPLEFRACGQSTVDPVVAGDGS